MKKNRILSLMFAAVLAAGAAGCEQNDSSGETAVVSAATALTTTAVTSEASDEETAPDRYTKQKVRLISIENGILTCEYEGETKTFSADCMREEAPVGAGRTVTEKVLERLFASQDEVCAELLFDGRQLVSVDVKKPNNVTDFDNYSMEGFAADPKNNLKSTEVSLVRNGSTVELSSPGSTVKCDINDMNSQYKGNIPVEADRIRFEAVRLPDGYVMLIRLFRYDHDEDSPGGPCPQYSPYSCDDLYGFFGTVQSVSDGRAEVLLNDGITVCNVPAYYYEDEPCEGQQVLLTLDAEPELFGSGECFTADYAVFTTHPEAFVEGYKKEDHAKYAYALRDEHNSVVYHGVMRDEALTQ